MIEAIGERTTAIETRQLTRAYGERLAVDRLDLRIRQGEVFGFLGPNGAGKTTTLRMLLGLIAPTSGSAVVAGGSPGSAESLDQVGAMIEQPGFYPYLSGAENLRLMADYSRVEPQRVAAVLDQVVLILDEPSNGLDPAGMAEMRTLIRSLADEGRTVLLSSHLLGEIEQICDRIGVIREGQLVAEGTVAELRGDELLSVVATPFDAAWNYLLSRQDLEIVDTADGAIQLRTDRARTASITRGLVEAGFDVTELTWRRQTLEDVFLDLTNRVEAA